MYKEVKLPLSKVAYELLSRDTLPKIYNVKEIMSLFYRVGNQTFHVIERINGDSVVYNPSISKINVTKDYIEFIHGGFKTLRGRRLFSVLYDLNIYETSVTIDVVKLLKTLQYSVDYYSSNMALVKRDILEPALKDIRNNGYDIEYEIEKEGNNRVITFGMK